MYYGGPLKHNISHTIVFISLALIAGCDSSTEPVYDAYSFFPLNEGNKWYYMQYSSAGSDTTEYVYEALPETSINGKFYAPVIRSVSSSARIDTFFYRNEGTVLYYIDPYSGREKVAADFSASLNDTAWWNNELVVTEKTKNVFTISSVFIADYGYKISYKRGTGVTFEASNGFVYYSRTLVKAEIKLELF